MASRIQEVLRPLQRRDPSTLFEEIRNDPEIVVRHLFNRQERVLPQHDLEVSPTPTQIEEVVSELFPELPPEERLASWLELREDVIFRTEIDSTLRSVHAGPDRVCSTWREYLYSIVRYKQPTRVVETGVRGGLSSAYILNALNKNGGGKLISLDIGDESLIPHELENPETGWMVPERLRDRWELHLGDSQAVLPTVLSDESVDVFLSDVPNSILEAELATAAEYLNTGSIIITCYPISSDAKTIWDDFSKDNLDPIVTGIRWKSGDEESKIAMGVVR